MWSKNYFGSREEIEESGEGRKEMERFITVKGLFSFSETPIRYFRLFCVTRSSQAVSYHTSELF